MAENTKIQWADHTLNPWRGCTKVAEGCKFCYADELSKRNPGTLGIWGDEGSRVVASETMWQEPVKWNKAAELNFYQACSLGDEKEYVRPRVFCASLADVFEDWKGPMINSSGRQLCWVGGRMQPEHPDSASRFKPVTMDDVRARLFRLIDDTPHLDWLLLTKRPENIRRMWPAYFPTPRKENDG